MTTAAQAAIDLTRLRRLDNGLAQLLDTAMEIDQEAPEFLATYFTAQHKAALLNIRATIRSAAADITTALENTELA